MLFLHRERMKRELIKSIAITDSSLGEEEIEEKLEQGDLTALPTSILQVCCQIVGWLVAFSGVKGHGHWLKVGCLSR